MITLKLNNKKSLLYVHATKIFNNKIENDVILTKDAKLYFDNFKDSFERTDFYLRLCGLVDYKFKYVKTYNESDYNLFIEIMSQKWVEAGNGLIVSINGKAITKQGDYKSINYYNKIEGTINDSSGNQYSLPRLIYSTFNTEGIKYDDIISISFKDGDNTNNSFDNLIINKLMDLEANLNTFEFDEVFKPHKLYLILAISNVSNELYGKIGVTKYDVEKRFKNENIRILKKFEFDFSNGIIARGFESLILERIFTSEIRINLKDETKISGKSECFKPEYYESILSQIKEKILNDETYNFTPIYKYFFDAIEPFDDDIRLKMYETILNYTFLGIEPNKDDKYVKMLFLIYKERLNKLK